MNGECKHNWKEEYYGTRCDICGLFYAFGCAPWDDTEGDLEDMEIERDLCPQCDASILEGDSHDSECPYA